MVSRETNPVGCVCFIVLSFWFVASFFRQVPSDDDAWFFAFFLEAAYSSAGRLRVVGADLFPFSAWFGIYLDEIRLREPGHFEETLDEQVFRNTTTRSDDTDQSVFFGPKERPIRICRKHIVNADRRLCLVVFRQAREVLRENINPFLAGRRDLRGPAPVAFLPT